MSKTQQKIVKGKARAKVYGKHDKKSIFVSNQLSDDKIDLARRF